MKKSLLKLFALLAVMSLVAAACGDSDDDSAGDDDASSEETTDDGGTTDDSAADAEPECVNPQGVTDDSIKFGSSLPLTGNLAALGAQASFALDATIKRINDAGGIEGRMLSVVVQDDEFNPEKTVANAQFFVDREEVFAIWASIGSAPLVAAIPIHNEADVATLFPWAQDASLFNRDVNPLFFSLNGSGGAQATSFSDYLGNEFDTGGETPVVALLYVNSPDGEQAVEGFKAGAAGAFEAASQSWERDATTYQPQLLAMADAGVTDVYAVVADTQFAQIIQEADQVGLEARFWGTNAVVTTNVTDLAGELAEGALAVTVMSGLNDPISGLDNFRAEMAAVGAQEADLSAASLLAYSGGLVLEQALRDAGPCLNNDTLVEALLALDGFETGGIMSPITFDPATGLGNQGAVVQRVIDGVWTRIN